MAEGDGLGRGGPGGAARQQHAAALARVRAVLTAHGVAWGAGTSVGESIYGQRLDADVDLLDGEYDRGHHPHRVAGVIVRWQGSSGSADHKLPHLLLSIERAHVPVVLVIDGEGWSRGALAWLGEQRGERLLATLRLDQFEDWTAAWPR